MRQYKNTETVDAVVIGTGAGGAPLLARLAKRGLKVVSLEAGPQWQPAADFATDERAQSKLFWNEERLSAGADPLAFGRNNSGTGVGGSTLHFTGYTPRPQPSDFRLYSDFGVGKDWPIGYTDLEPYYDELELFLGVSGPSPYPWGPPRNVAYPLLPLPLNGAAQLMARGCKGLHIKTAPAPNAILSAPYYQHTVGYRQACTNRGFCQAGCSTGAKGSTDVTFIPLAIHYGAEIRPECLAQTVERDAAGKITAVVYKRKGATERQACRHLFLCAGAIETPRLLLLNGLANSSGQVGKNFMAHVGMQVWGKFQESVHPYKGVPATLISEDMNRPPGADFAGGYLLQSIGVMPVTYASQLTRATGVWGRQLREKMQTYNHVAGINMHGTCLPNQSNYLELSDEPDATGLPKPRIYFTAGENEKKLARHGEALMQQIWKEAGAEETFSYSRFAHTMGTCCMGKNQESAVVDAEGRSFDVPNLYICDNSVFPDSLTVNPALTIMALSLRTADLFLQKIKKGLEAKN
jgi:choline dehydrogenase-like flavoprotein